MAYKHEQKKEALGICLSIFYGDIETLRDEIGEVVENAPNQELPRIQTLSETVSTLETVEEQEFPADLPGDLEKRECSYSIMVKPGKQRGRESRATRCGNACNAGRAALDELRAFMESADNKLTDDQHDELEDFCTNLEEAVDNAESAEFPGMYG